MPCFRAATATGLDVLILQGTAGQLVNATEQFAEKSQRAASQIAVLSSTPAILGVVSNLTEGIVLAADVSIWIGMLLAEAQQIFEAFSTAIESVGQQAKAANPDAAELRSHFLSCQQQFQRQILSLDPSELGTESAQEIQRCQTEMNRLMRLLGTDISFLQTARQSTTRQQRQAQICQRIEQLQNFCQGILTLTSGSA
ncbi:MAG: heterocyst frequency control protein PatD [Cyanobacteria bacterium P01_C01_bin.73]